MLVLYFIFIRSLWVMAWEEADPRFLFALLKFSSTSDLSFFYHSSNLILYPSIFYISPPILSSSIKPSSPVLSCYPHLVLRKTTLLSSILLLLSSFSFRSILISLLPSFPTLISSSSFTHRSWGLYVNKVWKECMSAY